MKKLIPFVLAVYAVAMVGCTTTTTTSTTPATTTTTTTTQRQQSSARMNPTIDANRSERGPTLGPR